MTLVGKIALSVTLLITVAAVALAANQVRIDGDRRVVQGAAIWAFLGVVGSVAIIIFDVVYRWTRRALREMRQPSNEAARGEAAGLRERGGGLR
jgi:integral membrane sensor domain MASE1